MFILFYFILFYFILFCFKYKFLFQGDFSSDASYREYYPQNQLELEYLKEENSEDEQDDDIKYRMKMKEELEQLKSLPVIKEKKETKKEKIAKYENKINKKLGEVMKFMETGKGDDNDDEGEGDDQNTMFGDD